MAQNRYYASTAKQASLAAAIDSVAASISLDLVTGFPSNFPFTIVIDPDTNKEELVKVNGISGTVAAVTRGQDGTVAIAHAIGATVRHVVSGQDFNEFSAHAGTSADPTKSGVHGVTSDIVGKDDTQTLTNKTLSGAIITGSVVATGGIQFEGSTNDANETTLTVVDPTADRTITLPNATGTVTLDGVASTLTSKTITSGTLGSDLAAGGFKVSGLADPSADQDAATKAYVVARIADLTTGAPALMNTLDELAAALGDDPNFASTIATSIGTKVAKAGDSMTGALSMGSNKITNLATPTAATDATNKTYIDTLFGSTTSAAVSASSASVSASSASTSASSALTSATSAAVSATSSASSATLAATSATSAATSASLAATSATSAATSATNSATSATNAATSAASASTSASSAATSATSAAGSATAASASQTSSATSATNAATSAASASTSASSALTSASSATTSAASAAASAISAATSYDDFDDRYLGAKSSAPSVDNDGNALITGALYFNSATGIMGVWSGSAWVAINTTSTYSAPTLGSTLISSGTTVSNVTGLTINSTTIPTSKTLVAIDSTAYVVPATSVITTLQTNTAFGQVPAQVVLQASSNNFQIGSMSTFTTGDLAIFNNAFPVGSVVTISGSGGTNSFTITSAATIGGGNINAPITTAASGFIFYSGNATLTSGVSTAGKYLTNNGTSTSWGTIDLTSYATTTTVENNYIMALMGAI